MIKIITSIFLIVSLMSFPILLKAGNPAAVDTTRQKASYYLQTTFGASILFGDGTLTSFSIVNGVRINKIFALGLGVNLEADASRHKWLPIYMHFNVNLLKKRLTPVVIAEAGSGLTLGSVEPIIYGSAQLGLSYYFNNKLGMLFAWGWRVYDLPVDGTLYNGLVVRGGLTF